MTIYSYWNNFVKNIYKRAYEILDKTIIGDQMVAQAELTEKQQEGLELSTLLRESPKVSLLIDACKGVSGFSKVDALIGVYTAGIEYCTEAAKGNGSLVQKAKYEGAIPVLESRIGELREKYPWTKLEGPNVDSGLRGKQNYSNFNGRMGVVDSDGKRRSVYLK